MKTWASCWKVFWTSLLFSKYLGPLLDLPSFRVQMIRWDSMHIINLGVDLWICGSVIRKLLSYDLFGGLDLNEEDRLLIAYDSFKDWARKNKVQYLFCNWFIFLGFCQNFFNNNHKWYIYIHVYMKTWQNTFTINQTLCFPPRHSMPKFRPWRLRSKQHVYPELQAKAYNVVCLNLALVVLNL